MFELIRRVREERARVRAKTRANDGRDDNDDDDDGPGPSAFAVNLPSWFGVSNGPVPTA